MHPQFQTGRCARPLGVRPWRRSPASASPAREVPPAAGGPVTGARAFTLIELMVVMVLIGILSAMILPEMTGTYSDALLRSSARDLVNAFSIANSRAISLNQKQLVRISEKTGRYEIERQLPGQGRRAEFVPVKDVAEGSGELDSRIRVELRKANSDEAGKPAAEEAPPLSEESEEPTPPGTVAFYPDGTADAAEVLLRDRAGFGLRLRVSPITARVQILEVTRE